MLERLVDRISRSEWRDQIVVKGGVLIGSLIGVERRTTKDLDTTVQLRRHRVKTGSSDMMTLLRSPRDVLATIFGFMVSKHSNLWGRKVRIYGMQIFGFMVSPLWPRHRIRA